MGTYGKGTYTVSSKRLESSWYVADAENQVLGRLASRVASVLRGKHRADYTPYMDLGDRVVVVNAAKIVLTGKKLEQKRYFHHTGYPGGAKFEAASDLMKNDPTRIFTEAVQGMLPKGPLGKQLLKKLRVYADADHEQVAQNPQPLP